MPVSAIGRAAQPRWRQADVTEPIKRSLRSAEDRHARAHQQRGALEAGRTAQSSAGRGLHPLRGQRRRRHRRRDAHLSRPQSPRQPGRAPPDRAGHQARRPRRSAVRQVGRNLCGDAGGDEGQRRLCAARRRVPDRAHPLHPRRRRAQRDRLDVGASSSVSRRSTSRRSSSTRRRRAIDAKAGGPGHRRRADLRSALLHHLHLRHDRQSEGRRHRARQHLQFRARRGRALRLRAGRPRLSGHDDRLRLFGRGDLGAADGRRDARPGAAGLDA